MSVFYFFSYGSNLLFERIHRRVDTVEVIQTHRLHEYKLLFNKQSIDGSMKANIIPYNDSFVWGVIHRIDYSQKSILDEYEALGKGYELEFFEIELEGKECSVGFYQASDQKYLGDGKPYDWYLEYVRRGAIENGFPTEYIEQIENIEYKKDQKESRSEENWKVLNGK